MDIVEMKIGVMQPYFFPYIGYFQLINAVNIFILYDDVNYIKNGWINRNRILLNSKNHLITMSVKKATSFKRINEIELVENKVKIKILKTIKQAYSKALYFSDVFPIIEKLILYEEPKLSIYLENSIKYLCKYIGIKTKILISSKIDKNDDLTGQDKIISICKQFNATEYINAVGGQSLYSKEIFLKNGLKLSFIKCSTIKYKQFSTDFFIPMLSVIDILMFNSTDEIRNMLYEYELI